MKKSIKNELFVNMMKMLTLTIIIVIVGLLGTLILNKISKNIIVEYNEINAIRNLNYSLNKILRQVNNYLIMKEKSRDINFNSTLQELKTAYEETKKNISAKHKNDLLKKIEIDVNTFLQIYESNTNEFNKLSDHDLKTLSVILNNLATNVDKEIVKCQKETNDEILGYIKINRRVSIYGVYTLITTGILIILISIFWMQKFVKRLTQPITQLIDFTYQVANGNMRYKTDLKFGNELDILADSFNKMMVTLNDTTVSKNYLDRILKNMIDAIIITDELGNIKDINNSAIQMFAYTKAELIGRNISFLFVDNDDENLDILTKSKKQNVEYEILSKGGQKIFVLLSFSIMEGEDSLNKIIFVLHDISEKLKMQKKLEAEEKNRVVAIIEAQEDAKLRIATDLHDGLGQILTSIKYDIEGGLAEKIKKYPELIETTDMLNDKLDLAIKETKSIAHDIIPLLLKDFGLIVALKNLVLQINSNKKLKIQINDYNFTDRLEPKLEKILYRICQEALNNIIKHADAKNVHVQLFKHEESVVLVVDDDGKGFDVNNINYKIKHSGIGLIMMKERISARNGTITINSELNKGTEILVEIPL